MPNARLPRDILYELTSPLVQKAPKKGEEINTKELHPFWTVIQQKSSKSVHNMELSEVHIDVPHPLIKGLTKTPWVTTITLPVLYNIDAIESDDILTLRYLPDEEDDQ